MTLITQKLIFILGKGGVGRSTISASLANYYAKQNEKVLLVQWALNDSISNFFTKPYCHHYATEVQKNLFVMNFSAIEAIKEYFIDYLKMPTMYKLVISHDGIQNLLLTLPGIQELFFLGRLLWQAELSEKQRGWSYDRIIVDTPATGHGLSLFQIPATISNFGITGTLATECGRVNKMLLDKNKTAFIVVTLPEELPTEETKELIINLYKIVARNPLLVCMNKSSSHILSAFRSSFSGLSWFQKLRDKLNDENNEHYLEAFFEILVKRYSYENEIKQFLKSYEYTDFMNIQDILFEHKYFTHDTILQNATQAFQQFLIK